MDNLHLYICCFFGILIVGYIIYEDISHQRVSDLGIIFLASLLVVKNGFAPMIIEKQISFLFISLGATYFLKIVFENILFYFTSSENFEFGEADVLLIGVLGMNYSVTGYILFLYVTFILWLGLIIYKFYFVKKRIKKGGDFIRVPFVPYIFAGALIIYVLNN